MRAAAVELVGTLKSKILSMENTKKIYRIPRDKLDQVISWRTHDGGVQRAPGPGQSIKPQAPSSKRQASSFKHQERQASSDKRQAPSIKVQAPSHKRQAP